MNEYYYLSDIGKIVSGATPKTSDPENYGGDIVWITPADLSGYSSKYISHGARNITQKGYDSCSTQLMPKGSVLFSSRAPIGYVAIAASDICTNQGFKSIVPDERVDSEFLYYQLKYLKKTIQDLGRGTTFKEVSAKEMSKVTVWLPSMEKQRELVSRIEELASNLDEAVRTLQATKQQLAVYRQAVLKQAFEGRYTFSWRKSHPDINAKSDFAQIQISNAVFRDTSGDENEISLLLPASWVKCRIGDIFEVEVGATPSRRHPEYWNGNINWISSGEVQFQDINETKEKITEDGLEHSSTNVHQPGTVVLAMIGEGKTRGQAAIQNIPAAHNQNTAAILVSMTPCSPEYLYPELFTAA